MPKWVRDAVFFRDHGRCVFCHANLSGLLSLDRLDPFDHIVPLAKGGINDPTNVQLLCETCNLKKSDCDARTGLRYPAWWPE
jgi:5-methylcytosine-specific restriction endonuclease McrA